MNERRTPAHNTGFTSGGVTCKLEALCFVSSLVVADSFVLKSPPESATLNLLKCEAPKPLVLRIFFCIVYLQRRIAHFSIV